MRFTSVRRVVALCSVLALAGCGESSGAVGGAGGSGGIGGVGGAGGASGIGGVGGAGGAEAFDCGVVDEGQECVVGSTLECLAKCEPCATDVILRDCLLRCGSWQVAGGWGGYDFDCRDFIENMPLCTSVDECVPGDECRGDPPGILKNCQTPCESDADCEDDEKCWPTVHGGPICSCNGGGHQCREEFQ